MQNFLRFFLMNLLVLAGYRCALAHPGHGTTEPTSVAHVAEPVHLLPILFAVVAVSLISMLAYRQFRQVRERQAQR